ncbi:hypothetical protein L810_2324 [Burkholderia sp. AU4i]|nr:hypothetical protein L810_2324 [Burkholderia sp. AU4i]
MLFICIPLYSVRSDTSCRHRGPASPGRHRAHAARRRAVNDHNASPPVGRNEYFRLSIFFLIV